MQHVLQFIAETHEVEASNQTKPLCTMKDVSDTYSRKIKNPAALGHLVAFTYLTTLFDKQDFPARHPDTILNRYKSQEALFWLKETHIKMMAPFLNDPVTSTDPHFPKANQLGQYRVLPAHNTLCPAPPPHLIPAILHNWIKELATLHHEIKDKVDNPYGIPKEQYKEMTRIIHDIPLFFSTVQPFQHGNNKLGRLIANALRIQWRMPIEYIVSNTYDNFKKDLNIYLEGPFQDLLKKARDLGPTF